MAYMTHKFDELLNNIIGNQSRAAYDREVRDTIVELRREVIRNPQLGVRLAEAVILASPFKEQVRACISASGLCGPFRLHSKRLPNWAHQRAYILYTEAPSPSHMPGPGFLMFNVREGEKAWMLHSWSPTTSNA